MTNRTFIFAGGGSGGHLFPSVAIAEAIEREDPTARCVFICSERPVDERILGSLGRESMMIPARPLVWRPAGVAKLAWRWGACVRAARGVIQAEMVRGRRVHVVTMGGFVAPPVMQAARAERAPVTLVNIDAKPGIANRWISRRATNRLTTWTSGNDKAGWTSIRPIVRTDAVARDDAAASRLACGLEAEKPTLLVTGGSLGARSINEFVIAFLQEHAGAMRGWQALHQCGDADVAALSEAYERAGVPAVVSPFLSDMGSAWGAAELAVARAGANTVAEVWANAVPTLFLPYPHHRDQHQRLNAEPLERAGGAVIATDRVDPEANLTAAGSILSDLLSDGARRERMRRSLRGLGPADGAETVAAELLRGTADLPDLERRSKVRIEDRPR